MANCNQCQAELDSDFGIQICPLCGSQNIFDVIGGISVSPMVSVNDETRSFESPSPYRSPVSNSLEVGEAVQNYQSLSPDFESLPEVTESPSAAHEEAPVGYYEIGETIEAPDVPSNPASFLDEIQSYADRNEGPTFKMEYDVMISQVDFKSQLLQLKEILNELSLDESQLSWKPQQAELVVKHLSMPRVSLLIKKLGELNVAYHIVASP